MTGIQPWPLGPNWMTRSALPAEFEFRNKNVAVLGSYRPIVSTPSPFQSPVSGSQLKATTWAMAKSKPRLAVWA